MIEFVEQHYQIVVGTIGVIVWLVRLEGKTIHNEKRLCHLETQMETMESGLVKELNEVKQSLARIEGYLKAKAEE
jgi:ribosomal protein L29